MSASSSKPESGRSGESNWLDVYARLNVRTVINAYETVSKVGGSLVRSEVLEAMRCAAGRFVFLDDLQSKAGDRVAELSRNEGAAITNGALAGLLLATAACLHRANSSPYWPITLPTAWQRNHVIVQRCQYSPYVPNIPQVGAKVVEIGYSQQRTPEEIFEAAFDDRTAAVLYTAGKPYELFSIPLERVISIAHNHNVPVIVDGAALLPPIHNLWHFTSLGAALVTFSGGKGLRGPQDSGVVVGRGDLIREIHRINSPHHGLGRAFKSSKEDIVGFLVALELAVHEDESVMYRHQVKRADRIRESLDGVTGIRTWTLPDGRQGQPCPRTIVQLLPESGWTRSEFISALVAHDPAIIVGELDEQSDAFYVNPRSLSNEEVVIVTARIIELISRNEERG